MAKAKEVDEKIHKQEPISPLAGIPAAIKDVLSTDGVETTCGSKILAGYVPPYSATVVDRLKANDMVMIGKANCDEFAMGSSTENSGYYPTCNPWNLRTVPGGSSGGSAASVAAGQAIYSLGTDTGGSVRQPASFCGVVGMKPTYGRVSRYGLIALASSLDQIGPFTKDVTDCALVMNAICGHDPLDSTSARVDTPDYTKSLVNDVKGLRIGVPKEYFAEGMEPEVRDAIEKSIRQMESLGAHVEEMSLPHSSYALATYYLIQPSECSSNLAKYDGARFGYRTPGAEDILTMYRKTRSEGFGKEVKRRIMLGTYALSSGYYDAYYLKAQKVRTLIRQDFEKAFAEYDVLLAPTSPTVAFEFGAKTDNPLQMYLSDICTIPINLAGIPGLSIPCGFSNGLPIGLQILGKPFSEDIMLRVAYTFEQNNEYHLARAALGNGGGARV
jgi:aspartyl-tRNA(Asn)/glutamyl-tRNA(Gln) amidotransferase subunit A